MRRFACDNGETGSNLHLNASRFRCAHVAPPSTSWTQVGRLTANPTFDLAQDGTTWNMAKTTKNRESNKDSREAVSYHLRVPIALDARIKEWIAAQPEEPKALTPTQAVLRLVLKGLQSKS